MILIPHHDPTRQNTDRTFQHAHMDVHRKAVYTLALK